MVGPLYFMVCVLGSYREHSWEMICGWGPSVCAGWKGHVLSGVLLPERAVCAIKR